ncbi:hypothetical protein [Parafilimonas sp.]|uniref:hypothetical protein n=1 Tax=Parafilimonas sp. TaxID=1969739 RepID=UPI0039E5721C
MQPDNNNNNNKAPQILNASSNFLGFCFLVLTSIKLFKFGAVTIIDEVTAVSFVLFMCSCLCAFLSIRSRTKRAELYEAIAEYTFLAGLFSIFFMTILFVLEIIH